MNTLLLLLLILFIILVCYCMNNTTIKQSFNNFNSTTRAEEIKNNWKNEHGPIKPSGGYYNKFIDYVQSEFDKHSREERSQLYNTMKDYIMNYSRDYAAADYGIWVSSKLNEDGKNQVKNISEEVIDSGNKSDPNYYPSEYVLSNL